MAERFILAGVGDIQLFDQSTGEIIVTSKTLTDSGINLSVTAEDIRGGMATREKYLHTDNQNMQNMTIENKNWGVHIQYGTCDSPNLGFIS